MKQEQNRTFPTLRLTWKLQGFAIRIIWDLINPATTALDGDNLRGTSTVIFELGFLVDGPSFSKNFKFCDSKWDTPITLQTCIGSNWQFDCLILGGLWRLLEWVNPSFYKMPGAMDDCTTGTTVTTLCEPMKWKRKFSVTTTIHWTWFSEKVIHTGGGIPRCSFLRYQLRCQK